MNTNKTKQQRILAYVLLGCSFILIPTKTAVGIPFLAIAIFTLWQSRVSDRNSQN